MPSPTKKQIVRHLDQSIGNLESAQDALRKTYNLYTPSYETQRGLLINLAQAIEEVKDLIQTFKSEYR